MWRLSAVRHKAGRKGRSLEELKFKRREHEKVLRQARRDSQLVSKRILQNEDHDDDDDDENNVDSGNGEKVLEIIHKLQHVGEDKEAYMKALRKAMYNPAAQLLFIKHENSMHFLVGLLSGSNPHCRLEAVRCLHVLSHSPHPTVGHACLPATPYLLTYLSGQSPKFTELCLYTLGNLCPDSETVREKLLAQGIIPALTSCIQIQRAHLAVVEAVGYTVSQILQAKDSEKRIVPMVLATKLPTRLLAVLTPDPQFGLAPAIECAWCLHYLTCSNVDNKTLVEQGALSQGSSLLVTLAGALAQGSKEEGVKLLVWPLLRCVGNLVSSGPVEILESHLKDLRLPGALCAFAQAYLHTHPALARESAWVLNNLTADSSVFCAALLVLKLVPVLIPLLPFAQGINTMILRVLCNVAHKGSEYCLRLAQAGLLPALCATLKMADPEMVTLSLELLFILVASSPQIAEEFVKQGGLSLLESIQYNSEGELRLRATHLLEHHLPSHDMVDNLPSQ